MTKFWMASVSKEHALRGVEGGFIQVCHGKKSPLKRMKKSDCLVVYSSKIAMEDREKYQKFTAIGKVKDEEVYSFQRSKSFFLSEGMLSFMIVKNALLFPSFLSLISSQIKKCGAILFALVSLKSAKKILI